MLYWSVLFTLLAFAAGIAGVGGVADVSAPVASGLFLLGAVMAVIALLLQRKAPLQARFGDAGDRT